MLLAKINYIEISGLRLIIKIMIDKLDINDKSVACPVKLIRD